jgi:hypothetical protein
VNLRSLNYELSLVRPRSFIWVIARRHSLIDHQLFESARDLGVMAELVAADIWDETAPPSNDRFVARCGASCKLQALIDESQSLESY